MNWRPMTAARSMTARSSGREPLDARREERVDRRRHLHRGELGGGLPPLPVAVQHAVLDEHAHQLADEQRVALARRQHTARDRGGELFGAEHVGRQLGGSARVERVQHDEVGDAVG